MRFLVSQMTDLKVRILDKIVRSEEVLPLDTPSDATIEAHKMTVCQAVEDRICKRLDLASRTDLTDLQIIDSLRLLLKIVRRSDLVVHFSSGEIFLLTHGQPVRPWVARTARWAPPRSPFGERDSSADGSPNP